MNFKKAVLLICLSSLPLFAKSNHKASKSQPKEEVKKEAEVDIKKLSVAIGHLLSKTIQEIGLDFDVDLIIQGLKEASQGLESPLSDVDCMSALSQEKKKQNDILAEKNLKEAETFLSEEAKKENICSLNDGKILYQILQEGQGESVKTAGKLSMRYKGSLLNGFVFAESEEADVIELNQLAPGLQAALVGMKEGEKRMIHIHPEQGYGTESFLPPNSLLTFEIEVAKASVEDTDKQLADSSKQELESDSEIR